MKSIACFPKCLFPVLGLLVFSLAGSAPPNPTGLEIIQKQDHLNHHFKDEKTLSEMILINKVGQKTSRKMETKLLENIEKGDKSIIRFLEPADIKNTTLLTHENKTGEDHQWLYLPAFKSVKRISGSNKSANFMGSEFTYEDLTPREISKYQYQFLRNEPCPSPGKNISCFVVKAQPLFKHSGYSKVISWIRHDNYQTVYQEFFDRKENPLKRGTYAGHKKINDQFWRFREVHMVNQQNQKETLWRILSRSLGNGFPSREFTKRAIEY